MKRFISTVLTCVSLLALGACNKQIKLREDIADFIENFSLTQAVEAYKKVEMIKEIYTNDNGVIGLKRETITFDVNEVTHPEYRYETKEYEGETLVKTSEEYLLYEEETIYLMHGGEKREYTLEQAHALIQNFFYKKTYLDGTYHTDGYYYGDIISRSAVDYQRYITIDVENELLLFKGQSQNKANNETVTRSSELVIDKLGMLIKNVAIAKSDTKESKTEINIKNINEVVSM